MLEAAHAARALEIISETTEPIHLMVADVVMPAMNGRELADRATAIRPDLKILFASGYTENVIAHHGVLEERLKFIATPYSALSFARKVRDVLDSSD